MHESITRRPGSFKETVKSLQNLDSLQAKYDFKIAILNNQYNGKTFENELWFKNEEDAIEWLK